MLPNNVNLLIIDDEIKALELLKYSLESEGFNITTASSGEDGLAVARKGSFDIIVLDIIMPGIDGWEVCRRLKADPITKSIPVAFLTALSNANNLERANKSGAALFISKPIDPDRLSITLKKLIFENKTAH